MSRGQYWGEQTLKFAFFKYLKFYLKKFDHITYYNFIYSENRRKLRKSFLGVVWLFYNYIRFLEPYGICFYSIARGEGATRGVDSVVRAWPQRQHLQRLYARLLTRAVCFALSKRVEQDLFAFFELKFIIINE